MSNRQVAKNALYLYLRTIITTIVGIYTSRVVLQTLGIEDYGLYNVVGGVVGLFGFINGAMSGSTSRFITFELGKGDKQRLHDTFNSAMIVHLIISGIVLILAETVGLWFLYNKLVIPESRMWAAQWVYQLSIISALLGVTQVPYDAVLIAHERFDVSAYISMFSTFAKLGVLYLVAYLPYDNLISYAILILLITVLTRMFARFYCAKHFDESKFRWVVNRELLKPMLSFSGWQMFGHLGSALNKHGKIVLVNIFCGLAVNSAVGIGHTFSGAVNGLAFNILQAFSPSIAKLYAMGKYKDFEKMLIRAATISFVLFGFLAIPTIVNRDFLLKIWLGNVPEYTSEICAVDLIFSNFMMLSITMNCAIITIGKIKKQQVYTVLMNVFSLLLMLVLFMKDVSFVCTYVIIGSLTLSNLIYSVFLFGRLYNFKAIRKYLVSAIIPLSVFFLALLGMIHFLYDMIENSWIRLIATFAMSLLMSCFYLLLTGNLTFAVGKYILRK